MCNSTFHRSGNPPSKPGHLVTLLSNSGWCDGVMQQSRSRVWGARSHCRPNWVMGNFDPSQVLAVLHSCAAQHYTIQLYGHTGMECSSGTRWGVAQWSSALQQHQQKLDVINAQEPTKGPNHDRRTAGGDAGGGYPLCSESCDTTVQLIHIWLHTHAASRHPPPRHHHWWSVLNGRWKSPD